MPFRATLFFSSVLLAAPLCAEPRSVSGIYPHLAMFNGEGECGTGAVVPWAGRLWVVTYAPHKPQGSSDKFYEITPALEQIIRPESVGGTPANRMIHQESQQLFIGPYVLDASGKVRTIPPGQMFGRLTGLARHLTDPAGKVVFATMEEGIYEVDVKSLAVHELWADEQQKPGRHADLPGYHGKGFYSSQGRYIYANNGDHAAEALTNPAVASGVLAEWDGRASQWKVVRRNQFTEVTGPGGITGGKPEDPVWSVGWDHRSLILMLLDGGRWQSFRLPKSSHSYDGAHGWNTEWPRIRDIGGPDLLMTMHGAFWKFPRTFSTGHTAGIAPVSNYLKVIGDFCEWNGRVVLGCDDNAKSEFLNKHPLKGDLAGPGQSQSNLWFLNPGQLGKLGPVIGRGAVWLDEPVKKDTVSEPFLFSGYHYKALHLTEQGSPDGRYPMIKLEVDRAGDGVWQELQNVTVDRSSWVDLSEHAGQWIRLRSDENLSKATAVFHYRNEDERLTVAAPAFNGLGIGDNSRGVLHARGGGMKTLRFVSGGVAYDLNGTLQLRRADDDAGAAWTLLNAAIPVSRIEKDEASVFYRDEKGTRWRLPAGAITVGARTAREICTERNLLNAAGTFYEFPAENAGGFAKIRPVCTHNRAISDYAGYCGLLVMSGVARDTPAGDHIIRSDDEKVALWVGAVDDLWQMGKPRGTGGPWQQTSVKAGAPSDPYLCTGYDKKRLTLTGSSAARVRIEADFTGTGTYALFTTLNLEEGKPLEYRFPDAFGAYWLRLVSDRDLTATAVFTWE